MPPCQVAFAGGEKKHIIMEKKTNLLTVHKSSPETAPPLFRRGEKGFLRKGGRLLKKADRVQMASRARRGARGALADHRAVKAGEGGRYSRVNRGQRSAANASAGCAYIYISSSANNTVYTLADYGGRVRTTLSAGGCGFKNTRKSTSYASQAAAERLASVAKRWNFRQIHLKIRGLGPGKLSGVRALGSSGLRIVKLSECTGLPHNGCRPPKSRRI